MCNINFLGPVKFSVLFPMKFLPVLAWKTTEKSMENFSESLNAKHWAIDTDIFIYLMISWVLQK